MANVPYTPIINNTIYGSRTQEPVPVEPSGADAFELARMTGAGSQDAALTIHSAAGAARDASVPTLRLDEAEMSAPYFHDPVDLL